MLTELEQKLIRLALDPAAQPGEIQGCAIKLVNFWRKRGLTAEQVFGAGNGAAAISQQYWGPDYGLCSMNFGKHKGKQFKDISPSYFRWLLPKLKAEPANSKFAESNTRLIQEIEAFLEQ